MRCMEAADAATKTTTSMDDGVKNVGYIVGATTGRITYQFDEIQEFMRALRAGTVDKDEAQ